MWSNLLARKDIDDRERKFRITLTDLSIPDNPQTKTLEFDLTSKTGQKAFKLLVKEIETNPSKYQDRDGLPLEKSHLIAKTLTLGFAIMEGLGWKESMKRANKTKWPPRSSS